MKQQPIIANIEEVYIQRWYEYYIKGEGRGKKNRRNKVLIKLSTFYQEKFSI